MVLWQNTNEDIKTALKLKYGFESAKSIQMYQIFASVVSSALGGKKKQKPPESFDQAMAQFQGVFGKKRF